MAREPTPKEKAKIAAGPRYDPGKPKPPWGERPPKPVSKVAAPPLPPPAPPPPPTLEPVIPQPYIEPKDAKVVSTDAKGRPTILETPDKKKYYTPFHTTMWGELGFATEDEYKKSQRTGIGSQYVGITKGVEKPVRVSRAEMVKAAELKGEKQFDAYKALGVIPRGSKFMPGPGGYLGLDWGYLHPDTLKKAKGRLIARQAASIIEPGIEFYKQFQKDWEKRHIKLADNKWMLITDWNRVPEKFQKIGIRFGYTPMNRAIKTQYAIEKRNYDAAIKALEPYKTVTGRPGAEDIAYDLYAARQAGVAKQYLVRLFGAKSLKETEKLLRERAEIIPAYDKIAVEELEKAAREHGKLWRYKGQTITDGERQDTIRAYEGLPYKERIGVAHPADAMTVVQPALVLAADPKWQKLKDRPKSDPERQAYLAEWQKKLIDTAAIAGTLAAPYTWGVVGAVGRALTPAKIAATPIIKYIPQIATALAQITFTGAPIAHTGATINESLQESNLQRKWEIFSNADPKLKDGYARMAGYDRPFNDLSDAEKASVLLHYTVPRDYSLSLWSSTLAKHTDKMVENVGKGAAWLQENHPNPFITYPVAFAGGAVMGLLEGISYTAQLPMIAASLAAKVPEGDPKQFAKEVGAGMAAFFTTVLPLAFRADPTLATGRVVGLFLLAPKSVLKLAQGAKFRLSKGYITERAMGQEIATLRVELIAGDLAKLTRVQRLKVGEQLVQQLLAGKETARLKIGKTQWIAEVRNVPLQQVKHNIGWHFTPDITKFDPAKGTGKLFLSPQAARQAGVASLVKGEKMKHPGLVEVHLPDKYSPKIEKLLSKKQVELEIPLKDRVYDPIPGLYGKGVSGNVVMGGYPIRRFTIRGTGVEGLPLTKQQVGQVGNLALNATVRELILGWHGRKMALKTKLAKDPRINKANESIKSLQNESPELVDAQGNVTRQRVPIPHPTKPGLMRNRVTAMMLDKQGRVLLAKTTSDPQFYSLPGGRVAAKPGLFPYRGKRTGKEITYAEAAAGQTQMETGIIWDGSAKYRGIYLGKINEYSLSGSRVYELKAKTTNVNVRKYGDTELSHAFWWDGKTKITVSPAVYHILKSYPHLDLSLVTVYKGSPLLNKAIDKGYVNRVKSGKFISEQNIARINKVELQRLQAARKTLIKGEPLGFQEWLLAENDFSTIAELIHGRRKAVNVIHDGKVSPQELKTLLEHPELITPDAWTLIQKAKTRKLSPGEVRLLEKKLTKAFETERAKVQDAFDRAYEASYRENRSYFDRRYAGLYEQIAARIAGIRRVTPERREAIIKEYLATLRTTRPEIYRPDARTMPVAYGKPYIPTEYRPPRLKPEVYKPAELLYRAPEAPPYKPVKPPPYKPVKPPPYKPPEKPPYKPPEKPPPPPPPPPPPVVPPRPKAPDKEKREKIREAGGAVCWRQGELKGKDIWRVVISPYTQLENWFYVVGRKPTGATLVKGPRSAYQTIKLLRGKPPAKKVTADMGAMDVSLEPKGAQIGIGFKPDPKLQTRSDIQLGKNGLPPISERQPPISERRRSLGRGQGPRITPRTPRLRR